METKQFSYLDSKGLSHEVTLSAKDFEFVQRDAIITDQKIQSKPTTFFKDAIRRFRKNKSSVAGGVILGILVALAIVLPLALPSDVDNPHPSETYLAPKLFDAGTGWWDGGLDYNNVVIDVDWEAYDRDGTLVGKPTDHDASMVIGGADGIRYHGVEYTNAINNYAHGGYVRINGSSATDKMPELHSWNGLSYDFTDDSKNYAISLNAVDPRANGLSSFWEFGAVVGYDVRLQWYTDPSHATKLSYTLAENVTDFGETVINLNDHLDGIKAVIDSDPASAGFYLLEAAFNSPEFVISLASTDTTQAVSNVVFKSIIFSSDDEAEAEALKSLSIYDANQALSIPPKDSQGKDNPYHWSTLNGNVNLFHSAIARASYRIDTYKEKYGLLFGTVDLTDLRTWADKGWVSADFDMIADLSGYNTDTIKILGAQFAQTIKVLDTTYSPLVIDEEHAIVGSGGGTSRYLSVTVSGHVWQWKKLYPGTTSMPRYLFGTDISGRDMLKYVFAGLRTSLLLGVITFLVNFSFGLVYGAIAGYFGGWTDIIMERRRALDRRHDLDDRLVRPYVHGLRDCVMHHGLDRHVFFDPYPVLPFQEPRIHFGGAYLGRQRRTSYLPPHLAQRRRYDRDLLRLDDPWRHLLRSDLGVLEPRYARHELLRRHPLGQPVANSNQPASHLVPVCHHGLDDDLLQLVRERVARCL